MRNKNLVGKTIFAIFIFGIAYFIRIQMRKSYVKGLNKGVEIALDTVNVLLRKAIDNNGEPLGLQIDSSDVYILRKKEILEIFKDK